MSPASLVFLVEHGFDFNYMVTAGVPFRPAGLAAATDTVRAQHGCFRMQLGSNTDARHGAL